MKLDSPSLTFESATGSVTLMDLMGEKGVLVYFMREFLCVHCLRHLVVLNKAYPKLVEAGLGVVVIGGGKPATAKAVAKRFACPFTVLADPDRSAYREFGLEIKFGIWQRSGSFLIRPNGEVDYELRTTYPNGLRLDDILSQQL